MKNIILAVSLIGILTGCKSLEIRPLQTVSYSDITDGSVNYYAFSTKGYRVALGYGLEGEIRANLINKYKNIGNGLVCINGNTGAIDQGACKTIYKKIR